MARRTNRRKFLQESAAIGVGLWAGGGVMAQQSVSANEAIRAACIGVGGSRGTQDLTETERFCDIVALCDIDGAFLDKAASREKSKNAKKFSDFRKMFDEIEKNIDAVTITIPDHSHVIAAANSLVRGKATFCQKPLTHTVWEARYLSNLAREKKVPTIMDNWGTRYDGLRHGAAIVKKGLLGAVKEVHVWTNRPIWPQGGDRPDPTTPVPETLDWDLWFGPAPTRPFAKEFYHPFRWRGWWDFGTGSLGDMACHTFNMPFMALDLKNPTSIEAEHSGHNKDSYPTWSTIKFEFPATATRPAIPVYWYDKLKRPPKELFGTRNIPNSGCLIVCEKDILHGIGDYSERIELLSGEKPPEAAFEKSPGHFAEFAREIKGGIRTVSNFPDYAGPLTETILLGNLAVWAGKGPNSEGKKVMWDSVNLKATNAPELDPLIKKTYRSGWKLPT